MHVDSTLFVYHLLCVIHREVSGLLFEQLICVCMCRTTAVVIVMCEAEQLLYEHDVLMFSSFQTTTNYLTGIQMYFHYYCVPLFLFLDVCYSFLMGLSNTPIAITIWQYHLLRTTY